jgi:hypothetical protein
MLKDIIKLILSFFGFLSDRKKAGADAKVVEQSEREREARARIDEAEAKPRDENTTKGTLYGGRF